MRASVLFEPRTPLKVEEVELEAPREGEVLVRMAASGVCHSCLHAADGSWKAANQFAKERRPKNDAQEVQTMWSVLALSRFIGAMG